MARVHNIFRTHKFSPLECDDKPEQTEGGIPVEKLEVTRITNTNLHEFGKGKTRIEDVWTGADSDKQPIATDIHGKLATWIGEIGFEPTGPSAFVKINLKRSGQVWIRGQMVTQDNVTARPSDCLPFGWKYSSPPARLKIIEASIPRLGSIEGAKLAITSPWTRIDEETARNFNFTEVKMAIPSHQHSQPDMERPAKGDSDTEAGGDSLSDSEAESEECYLSMFNVCGTLRDPHPDTTSKSHELYRDPWFIDRESYELKTWDDPNYLYKCEFCTHKRTHHLRGNLPAMPLSEGPKTDGTLHR